MGSTPERKPNGKRKTADEGEWIYTKFITTRSGKRIYAHQKGLNAFRIRVKSKRRTS
jgi:hypothetical protein